MNQPIFIYKSFGETLDFAESLGWQDKELVDFVREMVSYKEWNCKIAEALEYDALDFIKKKGFIGLL